MENTVSVLVARYIKAADVEEGKSRTTRKQYQNRLRIFSSWLGDGATLDRITLAVAYDFLYWLSEKVQAVKAVSRLGSASATPQSSTSSIP